MEVVTVRKLEFETDSFAFGDKILARWYPDKSDADKKGILIVVTTAKDGAIIGGPSFMQVLLTCTYESHTLTSHMRLQATCAYKPHAPQVTCTCNACTGYVFMYRLNIDAAVVLLSNTLHKAPKCESPIGQFLLQKVGDSVVDSVLGDNIPVLTEQEKFNETITSSIKRLEASITGMLFIQLTGFSICIYRHIY